MRRFASDRVGEILKRLGMKEGEEISHPWVTKSIARAQKKVENYHFEIRRNLLEYDGVLNEQRELVYNQRQRVLEEDDLSDIILALMSEVAVSQVGYFLSLPVVPAEEEREEEGERRGRGEGGTKNKGAVCLSKRKHSFIKITRTP